MNKPLKLCKDCQEKLDKMEDWEITAKENIQNLCLGKGHSGTCNLIPFRCQKLVKIKGSFEFEWLKK